MGESPSAFYYHLFKSMARHVKSCLKIGEPSSKPKNTELTDSAQVPWGKGEKPLGGVKFSNEIGCLISDRACLKWYRTYCIMGQQLYLFSVA